MFVQFGINRPGEGNLIMFLKTNLGYLFPDFPQKHAITGTYRPSLLLVW